MNNRNGLRAFRLAPRRVVAAAVGVYQSFLSPLLPNRCRFYPSCSEYAKQAILKHGIVKGSFLGFRRIVRCHPWNAGGYDPVE